MNIYFLLQDVIALVLHFFKNFDLFLCGTLPQCPREEIITAYSTMSLYLNRPIIFTYLPLISFRSKKFDLNILHVQIVLSILIWRLAISIWTRLLLHTVQIRVGSTMLQPRIMPRMWGPKLPSGLVVIFELWPSILVLYEKTTF